MFLMLYFLTMTFSKNIEIHSDMDHINSESKIAELILNGNVVIELCEESG